MNKQAFPFGDPDGARAELIDIMNGFVGFAGVSGWGGIATDPSDRTVRVIIGKKGSGKTIYLRRLQVSTRNEESVFSQTIQSDAPTTSQILKFCEICEGEQVTEKWRVLWTNSILISVLTHILYKKYFFGFTSSKERNELKAKYQSLLPKNSVPLSPYGIISFFISGLSTASRYDDFANRSLWPELKEDLTNILKDAPPVFYYLDAVDEEFSHAPMEWHQCQKGLFYAVMRMLREQGTLGGRLHVTICIRDIVFSSILRSEHASRYRNAPHICKLNWDTHRVKYFLNEKIKKLEGSYFETSKQERSVENFFGISEIENKARGTTEEISSYIVRHTRFLPRDIVEVGNELAKAKLGLKSMNRWDEQSWQDVIRRIVAKKSRTFAEEQLTICANQLASHDRPQFSAKHGYDELYTAGKEYIEARSAFFKKAIRIVGTETFDRDALESSREELREDTPHNVDIFSILWQNGLISCKLSQSTEGYQFFSLEDRDDFLIPPEAELFAFHSSIIDCTKIKTSPAAPIIESELF